MKSQLDLTLIDTQAANRKAALLELATIIDSDTLVSLRHAEEVAKFLIRINAAYELCDPEARQMLPDAVHLVIKNVPRMQEHLGYVVNNVDEHGNVRGLQGLYVAAETPAIESPIEAPPAEPMHAYTAVVMRPEYVLNDFADQTTNPWIGVVHATSAVAAVERARDLAARDDTKATADNPPAQDIEPSDYTVSALFAGNHYNQLGD